MHPVLFQFGEFKLHSFGLLLIIAFGAGAWLAAKRAKRFQFDPSKVADLCFWTLLAGVLGARVVYILQDLGHYLANPRELLTLQFQGLTSFGGLLFGIGAVALFSIRNKRSLLDVADLLAPSMLLGWAIGRIGCLLNGCCYGRICNEAYCVQAGDSINLHFPAQLIDSGLNLVFFIALLAIERIGLNKGQSFSLALAFHGLARFIYEFFRAGTVEEVKMGIASSTYWEGLPFPITEAQVAAGTLVVIGMAMFFAFQRRGMIQQEIRVAS